MMIHDRIVALATALQLTPTKNMTIRPERGGKRRWWLIGCEEGDQPLPATGGAKDVYEALEDAEGWLAPEIDAELKVYGLTPAEEGYAGMQD